MDTYDFMAAHEAARFNREMLTSSKKCGCFYCLQIFQPTEIEEWCSEQDENEEVTAICPYCGMDSVIGEDSGFPITQEFLRAMHRRWFEEEERNV